MNQLVAGTLSDEGYECRQAYDGVEALRLFHEFSPEAMVLDLNIPKIHGLEVLRQAKHLDPHAVVIVLTGHGSDQTASHAIKLGADDYLTKPFQHSGLLESLELHLKRADQLRGVEIPGELPSQGGVGYFAQLFLEAPAALVHADSSGAIRAVNRSAARLLARGPDELRGSSLGEIVPQEMRARWLDTVRREASMTRGYEGEVLLESAGTAFPANVVAVEKPEKDHLILALRDLTQQKTLERRYFESKRLASLGRVVEGVAHEVRNPLISIGGFARKLRPILGEGSRGDQYLEVILSEVERLERMVRDIEEFVQFSKQDRTRFSPLDLRSVLHGCLDAAAERCSAGGIRVRSDIPAALPSIYGDPSLLRELFDGLAENACEAMPSGGDLVLRCWLADRWIQVQVEDSGIGIAEEDLTEIFDPFFTSKTSGTGFGLARAYLIVEDHAGTIDFESRVGKGTLCTVSLPVDRRWVPRNPEPPTP